jgi:hypothetical protein
MLHRQFDSPTTAVQKSGAYGGQGKAVGFPRLTALLSLEGHPLIARPTRDFCQASTSSAVSAESCRGSWHPRPAQRCAHKRRQISGTRECPDGATRQDPSIEPNRRSPSWTKIPGTAIQFRSRRARNRPDRELQPKQTMLVPYLAGVLSL